MIGFGQVPFDLTQRRRLRPAATLRNNQLSTHEVIAMIEARDQFWLSSESAHVCRGGLGAALREGVLPASDYIDAIRRCDRCTSPTTFVKVISDRQVAHVVPGTCRNALLYQELIQG